MNRAPGIARRLSGLMDRSHCRIDRLQDLVQISGSLQGRFRFSSTSRPVQACSGRRLTHVLKPKKDSIPLEFLEGACFGLVYASVRDALRSATSESCVRQPRAMVGLTKSLLCVPPEQREHE